MPIAVGMIEILGFPAVVEAADAMVKAARVTLVGYEKVGDGRVTAIVRCDVSEVQAFVAAGIESARRVDGGKCCPPTLLLGHTKIWKVYCRLVAKITLSRFSI